MRGRAAGLRSAVLHPEQLPGQRFADRITVQYL